MEILNSLIFWSLQWNLYVGIILWFELLFLRHLAKQVVSDSVRQSSSYEQDYHSVANKFGQRRNELLNDYYLRMHASRSTTGWKWFLR